MKRGQVWVETVVYTLIGLVLIGVVLSFATPKINEYKDKSVIEQTIDSMNSMDGKINEILLAPGNKRVVQFLMKRGEIYFDKEEDKIYFQMNDSRFIYSEPGVETQLGRIKVLTQEGVKEHSVTLTLDYDFNLTFSEDNPRKFSAASTPYRFAFENLGVVNPVSDGGDGREVIEFTENS